MYQIAAEFDVTRICGKTITQISFGINFISLYTDIGFIQFTGDFSTTFNGKDRIDYDEVYPVKSDCGLLNILEKQITFIGFADSNTSIIIGVDDAIEIWIKASDNYESIIVNIEGDKVIV